MKSKDYISWDEYFMGVAVLSSMRSKDPNTKVGACIVNQNKRIVGIGYNAFPLDVMMMNILGNVKVNYLILSIHMLFMPNQMQF